MTLRKWTCKVRKGGIYSVLAPDINEAARLLTNRYRIDLRKLEYLNDEEVQAKVETSETCFVVTVGNRDYSVAATDELEALQAVARNGVNMAKVRNVRRQ